MVLKYQGGIRDVYLTVSWPDGGIQSWLAACLVMVSLLIQPYTCRTFLWDIIINEFNQGDLNCFRDVWPCQSPSAQKSCRQLLLELGYQSRQEKLLPFILERKTRTSKNPWRKWDKSECLNAKGVRKGIWKIVHDFPIEKRI